MLIGQTFSDDQTTSSTVQEIAMTSHSFCEDQASDILRCHYGTLSQFLRHPVRVAQYLYGERVITKTRLEIIKYTAKSPSTRKALFVLLQAVRHAVHTNYHNLEVFASILLKHTSNVPCAKAIIQDCREYWHRIYFCYMSILIGKAFPDYDIQVEYTRNNKGSQTLGKYWERFNLYLNYFNI